MVSNAAQRLLAKCALAGILATLPLAQGFAAEETPIGEAWWPSVHGAEDRAGASNWITAEKVLEAAQLIQRGKLVKLGRDYEAEMPLFGQRSFALRIPGAPAGGTFGHNHIVWNDDFLATEIGQVGTQFDGLGHIGVRVKGEADNAEVRYYNGLTGAEISTAYGLKELGVEQVKPFFTRGHLIDMVGYSGGMMEAGEVITVDDIKGALEMEGKSPDDIAKGDVVIFHTGWGSLWKENNGRFNGGEPGIGVEVAQWLAEKQVALVGADTWGVEAVPNPDENLVFPAHQILLTKHGIYLHENLATERLVENGVATFAYIYTPVPIKGATGSPGSPIAAF